MKVFILSLALFSGESFFPLLNSEQKSKKERKKRNSNFAVLDTLVCNANILWQQPPKSNLDMVRDAFWDYVAKATQTAEDSINQIMQSEMGREMK